jgi:tRNA threonylcarbamoyl adenosine modification protein TsaD
MVDLMLADLGHTELLGVLLAQKSQRGDVYLLTGELGSGKTSLCRAFLRDFTNDYDMDVPSPSYLITLQYPRGGSDPFLAHHIDPYRLSPGNVSCLIDFERAVKDELLLVEWPSRLGPQLSTLIDSKALRVLSIEFRGVGPQAVGRSIRITTRDSEKENEWLEDILSTWENHVDRTERDPKVLRVSNDKIMNRQSIPVGSISVSDNEALVMGIESSCDDTAVAILRGDGTIVAQCIASQASVHSEWGGVVPKLAQEEHAKAIKGTVDACLEKASISPSQLSAIAVTVGPGLALCLLVGVKKAIELSAEYQVPLVRVHHMEAHMMITRLPGLCQEVPVYPFLTLLVSGGHTMIVLTRDIGDHVIMGSTIDDSVGEAFDKTARLLGITSIPGGKELEALASTGDADSWSPPLPKPLSRTRDDSLRKGCDMSFAGLKTAVRMAVDTATAAQEKAGTEFCKANLAAAFQKCCADHLADKLKKALRIVMVGTEAQQPLVDGMKHIVIAGGVAANRTVRKAVVRVAEEFGLTVCVPPPVYCTDNGVMVAWTGIERLRRGLGEPAPRIKNLADAEKYSEARPRWPLGVRHGQCQGKINDSAGKALDRKANDMAKSRHPSSE